MPKVTLPDGRQFDLPKKSILIREIIDEYKYKGERLNNLSRKKLAKVVDLLLLYLGHLEIMTKHFENEWNKLKEPEEKDEQARETEIITEGDI